MGYAQQINYVTVCMQICMQDHVIVKTRLICCITTIAFRHCDLKRAQLNEMSVRVFNTALP